MLECVLVVASSHTTTNIICCPAPCSCSSLALGPYMPAHINKGRRLCAQFVCNLNSHTPGRVHGSTRGPSSTTTTTTDDVASPRLASHVLRPTPPAWPCLAFCFLPHVTLLALLLLLLVVVASPFCTWISTRQSKRWSWESFFLTFDSSLILASLSELFYAYELIWLEQLL